MTELTPPNPAAADDEIDLGLLWRALRHRWRFIVTTTLVAGALALLLVLFSRPVFQASGSLYLGDVNAKGGGMPTSGLAGAGLSMLFGGLLGGSGVDTQVQILDSRDLVVRAIEVSGLNTQVWPGDSDTPSSIREWSWRLHGKRRNQYAPGPKGLWAQNADVADPGLEKTLLHIRFATGGHYRIVNSTGQTVLEGRLDQAAVGQGLRLRLRVTRPGFVPAASAVYGLRIERARHLYLGLQKKGLYSVAAAAGGGNSSQPTLVVNLNFKDHNPYRAQRFLAALMEAYMAQNLRWSTEQAGTAYQYLNGQLNKIRHALENADQKLANYKKKTGIVAITADAKAMILQMAQYQTQRSAAELRLYNLQQIAASLEEPGTHIDRYLLSSVDDKVLVGLSLQLAAAQNKLASLTPQYTDQSPQVIEVRSQMQRVQTSIRALVRNQSALAKKQLADLDTLIARFEQRLKKLPQAELQVVTLTRSSEVLGQIYMFLLQKQEEAALQKAGTVTNNRILDHAEAADKPISPVARTDFALGIFLGLFLGISWVLGKTLLTPGFRSEDELHQAYPDLAGYALLTHYHRDQTRPTFEPAAARSSFGEAIRLLRSNIYLSQRAGRDKTWMITSAAPGDGKSTVCYELAIVLAGDGKKVLLVDADIRKPHGHEMLSTPQTPGLSDVLAGRHGWREAIHRVERFCFDLLPAGMVPPNPADLMSSTRLSEVITELGAAYDYVLFDTPPFPLVGDALLIAQHIERTLTVVRLGRTPRRALAEHLRRLPMMGFVLNDLGNEDGGYGYGYGYGNAYGYAYGNGNGNGDGSHGSPVPVWRRWLQRLPWLVRRHR